MYEVFEHTADVGLRIRASNVEDTFRDAAAGLLSLLVANPESVECVQKKSIHVQSDELDLLLFDWLTELLFVFETEELLFSKFELQISANRLDAVCHGEPMDRKRHRMDHEVKAVTYHELKVEETQDGLLAEVILDI